jgi:hypothetical protein
MIKACRSPAGRFMTITAFELLTHQMHGILWWQCSADTGTTGMTGSALTRGALENTRDMTRFTINTTV